MSGTHESDLVLQARTALSYEGVVDAARHEVAARVDAAAKAEQAAADRMKGIIQDRDELRIEADRKEATLKAFSQVCTLTDMNSATRSRLLYEDSSMCQIKQTERSKLRAVRPVL